MRCNFCERKCQLGDGKTGFCRMYTVSEGAIRERFPHRWSFYGASRMESVPFYHAYPGTQCLTIGTSSCNFRCRYCSNAFIAKKDPELLQDQMYHLAPSQLVAMAQKLNCDSIVFNVNEPTVSLLSLLDVAQEAKRVNMPMGCLTNGYTTIETTELLSSIFSFFNISLKGLSPDFSKTYVGIESSEAVLRNIEQLAQTRHVEVTTPIIKGANDSEIDTIAGFLAGVDPKMPWHVFRLLPEDEMKGAEYPEIQTIESSLQPAREKLPYIYFHNFIGSDWVNTLCPACGSDVIKRFSLGCGGDRLDRVLCETNRCPQCGQKIKLLR